MISGRVGYRRFVYPQSGEIVKVLAGRSFSAQGNNIPESGNTMSDNLQLNKAYVVPTGRKLTLLSYRLGFQFSTTNGGQTIKDGIEGRTYVPIGRGTNTTTSTYETIAHLDFAINNFLRNTEDASSNLWGHIFAQESGDMEVELPAGYYPKVGTVGRPGQASSYLGASLADVMIWGIEGAA